MMPGTDGRQDPLQLLLAFIVRPATSPVVIAGLL